LESEGFAAIPGTAFNDAVLLASCISRSLASFPAQRGTIISIWEVASSVVIAVSSLPYTVIASNNDVAGEGISGTISAIGIAIAAD
jgi:hypothetical protein